MRPRRSTGKDPRCARGERRHPTGAPDPGELQVRGRMPASSWSAHHPGEFRLLMGIHRPGAHSPRGCLPSNTAAWVLPHLQTTYRKSEGKPHRMKTGKDTGMPGRGCGEAEGESGRLPAHFPAHYSTVRTGPRLSAAPSPPARHSSPSRRAPFDRLLPHLLPSRRSGTRERKPGHACKSKPDRPRTPAFQYLVLVGRQKTTHTENRLYPYRVNPGRISRPRAVLELQDRGHPGSLPGGGSA